MTTTAGELRPVDIGRPIEVAIGYSDGKLLAGPVRGRLRALHAHGQADVTLWVSGDPDWPADEPIDLLRGYRVTLGDHPEASRR